MNADELVESILVSVQWDCWRFPIPYAKPLLKLDVAVVSHGHEDHWHPNFLYKDVVLLPQETCAPDAFKSLRNLLEVNRYVSFKNMQFVKIDWRLLRQTLAVNISRPHACWWVATSSGVRVLFIGDLNVADVEILRQYLVRAYANDAPIHGLILPSFGGALTHGATQAMKLSKGVAELADFAKANYGVILGALPHPVTSNWADFNAVRV